MRHIQIIPFYIFLCLFTVPVALSSNVPAFGSSLASLIFLDSENSTILPKETLHVLVGHRGDNTAPTELAVVRTSEEKYEIWIKGSVKPSLTFVASYDSFFLFLMDMDGDGAEEVFLEYGVGRGTFVYERVLEVYRVTGDEFELVSKFELNGYFIDPETNELDGWLKRYRLIRNPETGIVDVRLILETPQSINISNRAEHEDVIETNGCIAILQSSGTVEMLTSYGKDRSPIISPDKRFVAFLRKSTNEATIVVGNYEDYPGDTILADQIWILDLETKEERLLVQDYNFESDSVIENSQRSINHIDDDNFAFSDDGKKIYFISSSGLNMGALHSVDVETGTERFLRGANDLGTLGLRHKKTR